MHVGIVFVRQRVRFACFGRDIVYFILRRWPRALVCRVRVFFAVRVQKARVHVIARGGIRHTRFLACNV